MGSFVPKNCKQEGSAIEEARRIIEVLEASVENYKSVGIIELNFKFNGEK